ncbi:MAG TPA: hypothetical protein VG367_16915 [Mucilaginibacter sp.]|jgi:hypothetical protein|nr:hypothetical protein [Mucilaginibacter sp.]
MKNSASSDNAASIVLKYLLQIIGLAFFYGVLLYTTIHVWIPLFTGHPFSKVSYTLFQDNNIHLLLIIYTLFSYFANNFMLKLYERGKTIQLLLSILIDIFILPAGLLLTVVYNNFTVKSGRAGIDDIYNIYIIIALLIIKEIIAARIILKKKVA